MNTEEKLYDIFESKLQEIEARFANGKPRWSYWNRLQNEWSEFLDGVEGLERSSKMMLLVLGKKDGLIVIDDPLSTSGNDCVIGVPSDTAMKILALEYVS
jgi:hypothetical protein